MTCFMYVAKTENGCFTKIGISSRPFFRMKTVGLHLKQRCRVVRLFAFAKREDAKRAETVVKERFKAKCVGREWFTCAESQMIQAASQSKKIAFAIE